MRHLSIVAWVSCAVLLTALQASAFERQDHAAPAKSPEATGQESPVTPLATGTVVKPSDSGSTTITIPGLGQVGVIPKLDFGMELLYGSEPKISTDPLTKKEDEGLQIRGTIKHRF